MNLEGSSHTYVINVSKGICEFSLDGCLVATSFQNKLNIRNARTLEVCNMFTFSDLIEYIEWSPDSNFILCASYRSNSIQVFSLYHEEWKCRLHDAESGIVDICWSPDSRHVLTSRCTLLGCSWRSRENGLCVALFNNYMAVTKDCTAICVWDSAVLGGFVQVYGVKAGEVVGSYEAPNGKITGIKTVAMAPSGQFLTLGCLDSKVRLLSHISWQSIVELSHPNVLPDRDCIVYQESVKHTKDIKAISERPVLISSLPYKPDATDTVGIGLLAYSSCGRLLAVRVDSMPAAVWIWNIPDFRLISLVVHNHSICGFSWSPIDSILAIASSSNFVSLWCPQKSTVHFGREMAFVREETGALFSYKSWIYDDAYHVIVEVVILVSNIMPNRKKPVTLETLAIKAVCLQIKKVAWTSISSCCKEKLVRLDWNVPETMVLDFKALKEYLHGNLPRAVASKMMLFLLRCITKLILRLKCTNDAFSKTGDSWCRDVIKDLVLVTINPHLTLLDISKEPYLVRKVLFENLGYLQNLEVLSIRAFQRWEITEDVFLRNLHSLEKLVSFKMEQDCTDSIIVALSESKSKLKSLLVSSSTKVTDKSIGPILKLKYLEQLDLSSTAITEAGCNSLLTQFACANDTSFSTTTSSPLKMVGCSLIRSDTLEILKKYYGNLTHITISSMYCNLLILKELDHLEQLELTGGSFVDDNVKGLLKEKGASIRVLNFLLFQDIDLMWIGKYCPNLQNFSVRSCALVDTLPASIKRSKDPVFQKVEKLTFYLTCSLHYVGFLLVNCINVKKLTIGLNHSIDDDFMAKVLAENPLAHLKEFKLLFSTRLTIRTIRLLMERCPLLDTLSGLETWHGIQRQELVTLSEKIKESNLDIYLDSIHNSRENISTHSEPS
ncbi:hypothetical protein C0J52_11145 [Blattella germanica]|nr:hypothetical protein C0J52_11145 [Blattella germanica]